MSESRTYVIIEPCGCLAAAAKVDPDRGGKQMASEVARWIKAGENVQQVSDDFVRQSKWGCEKCKSDKGRG